MHYDDLDDIWRQLLGRDAGQGVSLPDGSVAWSRLQVENMLKSLKGTKIAVLRGEFFRSEPIGIVPSFQGWECRRIPGESAIDYALRSRALTKGQIETEDHAELLVLLEFSDQDTAA